MATQSSQFSQVYAGDEINTLTEISQYVKSATLVESDSDTNVTTFAAGGGPVTENHIKGSNQGQLTVECFFDPALIALLWRIRGARSGSTWHCRQGNNASPTYGDQVYAGTFTLFGININYTVKQEITVSLDLRPTDGGSIIPAWYPG